ncbi:MAG: LysR substrate-binding domain-containing protein [Pseudomonadota bacterium]
MDIKQLRCFLAVAQHLNFGRAAAELHMTQPPLTRQIQGLERALGVTLFTRTKRHVALTAAGETLQQGAIQLLDQLDRLQQRTSWVAEGKLGELTIGFVSTANQRVLPPLLQQFRQQHPQVNLQLLELTGDEQIELLAQGEIDLGCLFEPVSHPLQSKVVSRERFVAVVPAAHPLAGGFDSDHAIPCRQLLKESFVFIPRSRSPRLFDCVMAYARAQGANPKISQEARQMQTVLGLVAAGVGVSIVPESVTQLRRDDIRYLPLQPEPPELATSIVWDAGNPSPVLPLFLQTLQ